MPPKVSSPSRSRSEQEKQRLKRQSRDVKSRLTPLKIYLLTYNIISTILWFNILFLTIKFIITPQTQFQTKQNQTFFSRLLSYGINNPIFPKPIDDFINSLRGSYDYKHLGRWIKWTQTLAMLEILNSGLGWVRSPLGTTVSQVASRLWTVWGVVEASPETHNNPLFTSMIFAWSVTEIIRYPFYALSILGIEVSWLNYLRYTTFIPLYPLGASSEAFLSFSTLPSLSKLPKLPNTFSATNLITKIITHLPSSWGKKVIHSQFGRGILWKAAQAGVRAKVNSGLSKSWGWMEMFRLVLFLIWWPSLFILYSHMLRQRKRVLDTGRKIGVKVKVT